MYRMILPFRQEILREGLLLLGIKFNDELKNLLSAPVYSPQIHVVMGLRP